MARSVFESLRIFWQNTISSVKKLRLWQSIADRAWLFEIIFGVLTLFISLAAYMVSQQANFLSGESNKIAITAIAQSEESNKIAITAIAQSDESNKIAATQVARSDESNKIAATAIAVSKKSVQDADSRSAESNQIARESLENSKTKLTIGVENATEFQLNQGAITFVCLHRIVINNGGGKAGEIEDYEFVLIFDNVNYSAKARDGTYLDTGDAENTQERKIQYFNEQLFTEQNMSEKVLFPLQVPANESVMLYSKVSIGVKGYLPKSIYQTIENQIGTEIVSSTVELDAPVIETVQTKYIFYDPNPAKPEPKRY